MHFNTDRENTLKKATYNRVQEKIISHSVSSFSFLMVLIQAIKSVLYLNGMSHYF